MTFFGIPVGFIAILIVFNGVSLFLGYVVGKDEARKHSQAHIRYLRRRLVGVKEEADAGRELRASIERTGAGRYSYVIQKPEETTQSPATLERQGPVE